MFGLRLTLLGHHNMQSARRKVSYLITILCTDLSLRLDDDLDGSLKYQYTVSSYLEFSSNNSGIRDVITFYNYLIATLR